MNVQDIELDLSKERHGNPIVRIGQGDSSGTTIRATVYDNGTVPSLSGFTVKMHMRLPDGRSYAEGGSCSLSGNVITCVVDESRFAVVDGYTDEAYFSLSSGTTVYSTSRFRVKVERAASKDADPGGMYTDDVEKATKAAREAADAANEAIEQIGTAVDDAQQAAEDAAQAVTDAQTAIQDADTAKQSAITAANQATAAANLANQRATEASQATAAANTATGKADDATDRAEAAIDAMGDISEQAVPLMSADVRGGAKLGDGLTVEDGMLRVIGLYVDEDGDWCQV